MALAGHEKILRVRWEIAPQLSHFEQITRDGGDVASGDGGWGRPTGAPSRHALKNLGADCLLAIRVWKTTFKAI